MKKCDSINYSLDFHYFSADWVGVKFLAWFDRQINNDENKRYQKELINKYSQINFVPISEIKDLYSQVFFNNICRKILIKSGSSYKEVFHICYQNLEITDIIVFTSKISKYIEAKSEFDTVSKVVDRFEALVGVVDDIINGQIIDYLIPLSLNKIPHNIHKYMNDDSFCFKSFNDVPLEGPSYNNIVKLTNDWKFGHPQEDINKFFNIIKSNKDNQKVLSAKLLTFYTTHPVNKICKHNLSKLKLNLSRLFGQVSLK